MKQGKSLVELAQEVQRQSDAKKDYIADTRELEIVPADQTVALRVNGQGTMSLDRNSHSQIAGHTDIPKKYYDRMIKEAPELLMDNVNHWFQEKPKRRMIRTLDGNARAFLSDRYRVLDNNEVLESILPVLAELDGDIKIASMDITDTRLYLKCVFPKIREEIKKGDIVEGGIVISNSEVGLGSISAMQLIHRLVCTNGLIANDYGMKKFHIGRANGEGQNAREFFKDDTLLADDQAFLLKLRDTVRAAIDGVKFKMIVDKMRDTTERKIDGDPVKSVEVVQKKYGMTEPEKVGVLTHLIQGGDLSQYGILNAITRTSQDLPSYDRATEFEKIGGKIIELKKNEWKEISQAA